MRYYSEKLDKMFDTVEQLQKEEKAAAIAEADKAKAAKARKEESKVVEDAFKTLNAAKKTYNAELKAARIKYSKDLLKLRTDFESSVMTLRKTLNEAEKAYEDALSNFIKQNPSGFHMTLKDGDTVVTLESGEDKAKQMFHQRGWDSYLEELFAMFDCLK